MYASTPRNSKKVCTLLGLALFAMMLVWLAGAIIIQRVLPENGIVPATNPWFLWLANDIPLYCVGLPLFLLITKFIKNAPVTPRPKIYFGSGKFFLCFFFCLGATYIINMAVNIPLFFSQFSMGEFDAIMQEALENMDMQGMYSSSIVEVALSGNMLQNIIFGMFVPAIGEEFIFRYMIFKKMRGCADRTYVFFSALCFGLFHANLSQTPYAFVIGVVLAWIYVNTGKIWLTMLMHFAVNSIGIVIVPAAFGNFALMLAIVPIVLLLMACAITFFFVFKNWFFACLLPPTEASWPYKPPKSKAIIKQRNIYGSAALSQYPAYWGNHAAYAALWGGIPPRDTGKGAAGVCLGNVGSILYILLSTGFIIFTLLATLGVI